jgi:hypothetical protein
MDVKALPGFDQGILKSSGIATIRYHFGENL